MSNKTLGYWLIATPFLAALIILAILTNPTVIGIVVLLGVIISATLIGIGVNLIIKD